MFEKKSAGRNDSRKRMQAAQKKRRALSGAQRRHAMTRAWLHHGSRRIGCCRHESLLMNSGSFFVGSACSMKDDKRTFYYPAAAEAKSRSRQVLRLTVSDFR